MSGTPRSIAVDPAVLVEHAGSVGRHQQSWQLLLNNQAPAVATNLFGEGLAPHAGRITAMLDDLHNVRLQHASQIQHAARLATQFAKRTEGADGEIGTQFDQVLP